MRTPKDGFTLVELVFGMAIASLLTSIAVPVYRSHIDKTKNNEAITHIYAIQLCIERYYTENFSYPDDLAEIADCLPNQGLDPWGNAYSYLNIIDGGPGVMGKVRKDKMLNPINTNYDLYSKGKNGVTKMQLDNKDSVDDVILARDGAFVGVSADF